MTEAQPAAASSPAAPDRPPSAPRRPLLHAILRIALWALAALLLLIAALLIAVATVDWNVARPWVSRKVVELTGRAFAIGGNLKVGYTLGLPTEPGWQRYVPRLRITGDNVRFANPAWASTGPDLLTARRVSVALHPLPLLKHRVVLSELIMDTPMLALERDAQGRRSWRLHDPDRPSPWRLEVLHSSFSNGDLVYVNRLLELDLRAKVTSLDDLNAKGPAGGQRFGLQFTATGTYRKASVNGSGKAGGLLAFTAEHAVFPIQAQALIGKNKAGIDGIINDPRAPAGLDLQLTLGGNSMSDLYPVTGVLLPQTPAYETRGRLIGTKNDGIWLWTYEKFTGRVGDSDLSGTAEYLPRQPKLPRPLLRGTITSQQLRLADLGPSVGAGAASGNARSQRRDKLLPDKQFRAERWAALDTDIAFKGKKIISNFAALQDVDTVIRMQDRVLNLAPLNFGLAGGKVTTNISLDGRHQPIAAQIKLAARQVKVRELFPKLKSMQASFGEINGDAALTGHGNSIAAMLGTANGEVGAVVSEGAVSKFILEAAGLNIANAIFAKVFGDKPVHLNCMVGDMVVNNGRADMRRFMLDTDDTRVDVAGGVDLSREQLDLDVRPKAKGVRIFSLRTPLYAKGTFAHPDIGPYKGPLAAKAAAAGALALLAPAAAVLPLVSMGDRRGNADDCALAMAKTAQTRAQPHSEPTAAPAKPVTQGDMEKPDKP
ncbi:AsmA family protein [Herbaspirillum lusitanum]|nr:AsmA family protein [Herbaspirillum lusitanum]